MFLISMSTATRPDNDASASCSVGTASDRSPDPSIRSAEHLREGQLADEARAVGRAIDGGVVDHDGLAVGRDPDVELDRARAGIHRRLERRERVLRAFGGCASVGDDQRQGSLTEWPFRHYRPPYVAGSPRTAGEWAR